MSDDKQYLNVKSPKRYNALKGIDLNGDIQSPMIERQSGEWVRYSDYLILLNVAKTMEEQRMKDSDYTLNLLNERERLKKLLKGLVADAK